MSNEWQARVTYANDRERTIVRLADPLIPSELEGQRLLRLPQVLALVPVCRSAWYRGVQLGFYPAPVHLPGSATAFWRSSDIAFLLSLAAP